MSALRLRAAGPADKSWVQEVLRAHWAGPQVVSRGRVYRADVLPGLIAELDGAPVGLATYHVDGESAELVTLDSLREGCGVGTALLAGVEQAARAAGCRRLWLVTTNDNVEALRFYQRRGFVLAALHRAAVEAARRLKPAIPAVGKGGIPIRDELELEKRLG